MYSINAVENYIKSLQPGSYDIDVIEGTLIDTLIISHYNGTGTITTEVFEETYANMYSSAYTRRIYKKRLPERFTKALEERK